MNLDQIRKSLEAAGTEVELIEAGHARALVLKHPRDSETRWIVDGDIADLLDPGAHVIGTEQLKVDGVNVPVTRLSMPSVRAYGKKIGEGPGNLEGRAAWFNKRR